jgi:hypothetical protein
VHSEVFHLAAGVSHLELGRFDLFRVNPPLVRSVAAVPAVLAQSYTDWRTYDTNPLRRAEYDVGIAFLRANDESSVWLTTLARWACIPFSILGGCVCYVWANRLYGPAPGFVALILWVTSPYVLGHAALITPDAHAAALGVMAGYCFWLWLRGPNMATTVAAGIALGLAELAKLTFLILLPLWLVIWVTYRFTQSGQLSRTGWFWQGFQIFLSLVLSVFLINLGYGFEATCRSIGSFHFKSLTLTGLVDPKDVPETGANRFANKWYSAMPVPLPANYIQGIDTQKADFERKPWSYLAGHWQRGGWWYFYFYALAIKMPLGTLGLAVLATLYSKRYAAALSDELVLLAPILAILVLLCWESGLGLHSRYAIPILPFFFIWISKVGNAFRFGHKWVAWIALACMVWSVGSSLYYYPHSLSYFNEVVGGPMNGFKHLAVSNTSWGQDLIYLKSWIGAHPEAHGIRVALCGPVDPRLLGIAVSVPPVGPRTSSVPNNSQLQQVGPVPGWFAVDTNLLTGGDPMGTADGKGGWKAPSSDTPGYDLSYFQQFEPVAAAGYSIYIYHITLEDANRVRKQLGLAELISDISSGTSLSTR